MSEKSNPFKVGDKVYLKHRNRGVVRQVLGDDVVITTPYFCHEQIHHWKKLGLVVKRKKCDKCQRLEYHMDAIGAAEAKIKELEEKLAVYENAEKFWVGVGPTSNGHMSKEIDHKVKLWPEYWQVVVIDKKKGDVP